MRGNSQIVAMNDQIANGGNRQIHLQRLPGAAVIKGDENSGFSAREEQAAADGIFFNHTQK